MTSAAADGAATAKRGERDLYRLLRTLKKRDGGGGGNRNAFMHWLVHKRSGTDMMTPLNNAMLSWPKIRFLPRESRAREPEFRMPEDQGTKLHHFFRSLLRDNNMEDLLDYY